MLQCAVRPSVVTRVRSLHRRPAFRKFVASALLTASLFGVASNLPAQNLENRVSQRSTNSAALGEQHYFPIAHKVIAAIDTTGTNRSELYLTNHNPSDTMSATICYLTNIGVTNVNAKVSQTQLKVGTAG